MTARPGPHQARASRSRLRRRATWTPRPPRLSATQLWTRSATQSRRALDGGAWGASPSRGSPSWPGPPRGLGAVGRAVATRSSTCPPSRVLPGPRPCWLRLEAYSALPRAPRADGARGCSVALLPRGRAWVRARLRPSACPDTSARSTSRSVGALTRFRASSGYPSLDALLRPRPRVEDRVRRAARLLPGRAGRSGGDPRRGPASPRGRARPRGRGRGRCFVKGDPAEDHGHARGRAPRGARADGRRRARRQILGARVAASAT